MKNIAIDASGGDHAPAEIVRGAVAAARAHPGVAVTVVGRESEINQCLSGEGERPANLRVAKASQKIEMDERPVDSLRAKRDSSIVVGTKLVRDKQADAFISAGNTGAVVAAAFYLLGALEGVKRPGIAVPIPTERGTAILIDAGANTNCKPIHLLQYALMGSCYASLTNGIENPKIGLLNIGEEGSKGNELTKVSHELFKRTELNFDNAEGHELLSGKFDVIACDGFVGNVVLKLGEGMLGFMSRQILNGTTTGPLKDAVSRVGDRFDYSAYGGAPLLGVNGVVLKCHGRSKARAIENAAAVAVRLVENNINERITAQIRRISMWTRVSSWFAAHFKDEEEK